ncbi:nitrous oxide reductase accessory protein NosL [Natrinema limicola]|uniref:Lipoprotein n=1 Tax=Natrinema limicola JCM 13563 TaxID=1230457 RepID=M0CNJ2_9EURY|nr:nitrous oxide reductase accessory protein NosL [Natrinema limicola]ELZ24811.1 lipoprotein [Natrinema limicola JCM 13563]
MCEHDGLGRRRLLGALGVSATAGIAGCLGGNDSEDGGDEQAQVYEPSIEGVEEGPVEFTDSQRCDVCGMPVTKYFGNSQLVHENGQAAVFDLPGCLFAYKVSSTPDSPIQGAWTIDYETGDLVDATTANFVLITDKEAADDPMGIDPRPYANREDAVAFLESWEAEDLSPEEDIIVGLDEVDMEIAKIYRKSRLPDE